jgi:hypothetical protein
MSIKWFLKQKREMDKFTEVMFHVGERSWKVIISLLLVLKNDFCEVNEAIFQGVEMPCEIKFWPGPENS